MPVAPDLTPFFTLDVKVVPNAPRNEIAGRLGDALKVKIRAPALEGRANDELCAYLADILGLARRHVTLLRGAKSRQKSIRVDGLSAEEAIRRLGL